jgi:hypothetical protein
MGEIGNTYEFWSEDLMRKDHSEDLDIGDRIILRRILNGMRV